MLLLSVCLLLLFTPVCVPYNCEGTCEAFDEMSSGYDATCTKSEDCLVLSCGTPRQAATYHAVVQPRFRIYPCTDPVIVNFQLHASYSRQTFNENRNITGDTTFPETLYLLGKAYTVSIHIKLRQLSDDRILLGATGSFSTYTYTLFPDTVIPIDKSGCPGQEGTTKNTLCNVATSTVVTPSQPGNISNNQTGTTGTPKNNQTGTTGTPKNNQTGTTGTPKYNQTGTTGTPRIETRTTGTSNIQTGTTNVTVSFSSSGENSTISLSPNTHNNAGMIGGIVGAVLLVLVAAIIGVSILVLLLLYKRRHITMKTFRYSKFSSEELALS